MTYDVEGIILEKKPFRENDRLFTIYTRERGKIMAVGVSTRKKESKLAGNLELFTKAYFTIAHGKAFDRIATVDPLVHRPVLESTWDPFIAAVYGTSVVCDLVRGEESSVELYALLDAYVAALFEKKSINPVWYTDVFHARFLEILGHGAISLAGYHEQNHEKELRKRVDVMVRTLCDPLPASAIFYAYLTERSG